MSFLLTIGALAAQAATHSVEMPPIIDMHLHARTVSDTGDAPPLCAPFDIMPRSDAKNGVYKGLEFNGSPCSSPIPPASSDDLVLQGTIREMEVNNIFGVVSGEPNLLDIWLKAAPTRFIPSIDYRLPGTSGVEHVAPKSIDELRALHHAGKLAVIGEIMAQYEGVAVDDPRMDPVWALAVELDVPVAIHMGPGEPGQPYSSGAYRVSLGDPLLLEPVLRKYPKLRVSIMHAAYPMAERLRALMFSYPQVYAEIGSIVYTEPRPVFYDFLKQIVDAGYGDRIMFGSDQMIWPGVITPAVKAIHDAPFLNEAQKRDIFYNNAARFLRLSRDEIDRHHGR
ncbi:MAG: amidohydrolase family protein [Sphingorhabdus sp.]|uniref:amidohydrolase family protein n=1 Tax=Sphingorhabdus sp. TaxID=1902408 RepID=UPI0038FC026D